MSVTVRGFVSLPADVPERRAARVLVEVRDVSAADAPSLVVGAQVQTDVLLTPGGRIPFRIEVSDLDPHDSYGLRVHIDLAGTGAVESGDLINTEASPVPAVNADELVAPVRAV